MAEDGKTDAADPVALGTEFIESRLLTSFKHIAPPKFKKAFSSEENKKLITEFLTLQDVRCLLFSGDNLVAMLSMPKKLQKGKTVAFVKGSPMATTTNIAEEVVFTELTQDPLDHLEKISQEVYLPILGNAYNQEAWGEVATKDILDKFHSFLACTSITLGQTKGKTELPLPPPEATTTAGAPGVASAKNRMVLLEGAIITWTRQIKNVLKQDPETALKEGLHPGPEVEINFWQNKALNLNYIFQQLQSDRVRKVLRALDVSKSTYCTTFSRLCKEVFTARLEANDNLRYLKTLNKWIDELRRAEGSDFPNLIQYFKPIMHTILLIWKNSKYYNTPQRLVVLMREICNGLISQACTYISGESIFEMIEGESATTAVEMLKTTLKVCGSFKSAYFDYKATANAECPNNSWRIQNNALFMRLDSFLERCHDILDLTQTIVQFSKLATIEIGGTKGKTLTTSVQQIHTDFTSAVETFQNVNYDIMDVNAKEFDDDFYEFRCKIKELERRLGSVLTQGFDDCSTIFGQFKLLDSFDSLLERPIIQDELEKKHVTLIQAYGSDLKKVQEMFIQKSQSPPVSKNLPQLVGSIMWCRGLKDRVQEPMTKLTQLNKSILEREEAKEVLNIFKHVESSLMEYENEKTASWSKDVDTTSQATLKLPLLKRDEESGLLKVNFDPALVRLLREIKYFILLNIEVPDTGVALFKKAEVLRRQTGNLDLIVDIYNGMMTSLLPVEAPLVQAHLDKIDKTLQRGISVMNWKSHGIDTFITESMDTVKFANQILTTMKKNMASIESILRSWLDKPLITRTMKPVAVEVFEKNQKTSRLAAFALVKEGGQEIHKLIKESNKVLKVSNGLPDWKAYIDFLNNIVVEGLSKVVRTALVFLREQIDPAQIQKQDKLPMLEVKLMLVGDSIIRFDPTVLSNSTGKNIGEVISEVIGQVMSVGTIFKRLDYPEGNYLKELHADIETCAILSEINGYLLDNQKLCLDYKEEYDKFSYLWTKNLETEFQTDLELATIVAPSGVKHLDLKKFDTAVKKYKAEMAAIQANKSSVDIGWLRVNNQPIKESITTWTSKWQYQYTGHMLEWISSTLSEFNEFIQSTGEGLKIQVPEGNKVVLMEAMGFIRDVRKRIDEVGDILNPLRECAALLKKYGIDVDENRIRDQDLYDYLEVFHEEWEELVNSTFKKKEDILPLQTAESERIKADLDKFFNKVRTFRNSFRKEGPCMYEGSLQGAYEMMDTWAEKVKDLFIQARNLNNLEELFELSVSKYVELPESDYELKVLKKLWDFKAKVEFSYGDWRQITWNEINTEDLEDQNKLLKNQIRVIASQDQIAKQWNIYRDIEALVKNMGVVLPLVNDLHSPSMRDRHWKQLFVVCNTRSIERDNKFCLDDLLGLQLHKHADDVSEIVETANKELKIEKKLQEIEETWTTMMLEFVPHKDSDVFIVKVAEEVVESLDAHQLELQTMVGMGKFVEYFRDRVMTWQKTLGNVESVLGKWVVVSRQWAALEAIFLGSADIRSQLPDDTKRFEGIDQEFKDMMKEAVNIPNVVESCNVDGKEDVLKSMGVRLEQCQKSLNEYLDMKKTIFPRFYFVSNVALLEILSNGNDPARILPFLGDCYDSLANLIMTEEDPNTATTMVSKDGEQVKMGENFVIKGAVENWLNDLTQAMQNTLKGWMNQAIESALDWENQLPRHKWLFNFPAQIDITTCQINWTEETESALEEYEGGTEESVRDYLKTCKSRLANLIELVLGDLKKSDRTKIITLITMDVHGRDVVAKLISEKSQGPGAFLWQQQLRFLWNDENKDINISITDFRGKYFYEWVGNTGRLVITPLTDRCYITLTMALRLFLGGAPAGPAGTGKTETTKDLARALALPCYVFNCSDQMNFQSMADIFRGLTQTGSWGCFDEFNRINIEVLSVVATQVKTCLDAVVHYSIPANRPEEYQHLPAGMPPTKVGNFNFMGTDLTLIPTCGFWITMNPGYAGRTELPENLKALFRSCAMIRPDLKPICANMLMAEGFQTAEKLAVKFVTLYALNAELLSPQPHYDWGLRAVKSVLRVAGMLKRAEPNVPEDAILMRALRDFNTPKIPGHDMPIFLRLIDDLFMGLSVPPKVNNELKQKCIRVCKQAGWQHDDSFVKKVTEFQELLDVRHSVMLIGDAGCAKTTIWQALQACHNLDKPKPTCVAETVNPKAISSDELYGYMTLSKDWKDGALSIIMRGMAKNYADLGFHEYQSYKWCILDDDIDAVWIESMNTVMDDNKVLTLVSNERIPLSDAMRMVFEINSLKNATPATVSRAGILYINETDIGWRPFVESWIARLECDKEKSFLPGFFDKYIEPTIEMVRKGFKHVTPTRTMCKVQTLCALLETTLRQLDGGEKLQETMEFLFVYCVIWAFGGPLVVDKGGDCRKKFHEAFTSAFTNCKYPKDGLCFDFFYSAEANEWVHWNTQVPEYIPVAIGNGNGETPCSELVVDTMDSVRLTNLMDKLVERQRGVMFVGGAGTGKSTIVKQYLNSFKDSTKDNMLSNVINMNYYTESPQLQAQIEAPIDKRSGRMFGPPATKKLVFFIDDINLPIVETYGTQNALSLLRQHIDYGTFFDRVDLGYRKEVVDVQYVAAMNPTSGSFTINERLQRHFSTFACMMPSKSDLQGIYLNILGGHFQGFDDSVASMLPKIVDASIALLGMMAEKFLPSATKFTYNWNMREIANVFQGLTMSNSTYYSQTAKFVRLWIHESQRVYGDRLINETEITRFQDMLVETSKMFFEDEPQETVWEQPIIFTNFAVPTNGDPVYLAVPSSDHLKACLEQKLSDHNETYAMMDLVLFDQAMEHVTRIARIISSSAGNAMLIGVGGSGKQSLARLASFICQYEVKQLSVTSSFSVLDLQEAVKEMYKSAGVKGNPISWIMTDQQIVNERFLPLINDFLATAIIPDLFARDEWDGIFSGLRGEAKQSGIPDSIDAMTEFFIARVKKNLHLILCFSPVGDTFRVRARRFPGLINCTAIDYFHAWPRDALVSVAQRFTSELDLGIAPSGEDDTTEAECKENISHHMAECHISVTKQSLAYAKSQRRYNYVTPKSFLDLINFYKDLLAEKRAEIQGLIDRLDTGLSTLKKTSKDVAELQVDLKHTMVKVEEKKESTNLLLEQMGTQRGEAEAQQEIAMEEAAKAAEASAAAKVIEESAEKELSQAKPAMDAAVEAVDCLSKAMLGELKNLSKPPTGVDKVTATCLMMVENEFKNHSWDRAKKMMAKVDGFKEKLQKYDAENMTEDLIEKLTPFIKDPDFSVEAMTKKSAAAANLCNWVINIYTYNRIYVKVKPLMDSLTAARTAKAEAEEKVRKVEAQVADVQSRLQELQNTFLVATQDKAAVEAEAKACTDRLGLAERLVGGLASENERWGRDVETLRATAVTLVGDVLLSSAFVSYVGAFDSANRRALWEEQWIPDLVNRAIPLTEGTDPLQILTDEGKTAQMNSEGLPGDRVSVENGAIICSCKRWPLIIDPQLQGIKWLKNKEANEEDPDKLKILQLTSKTWLRDLSTSISNGSTVILENLGEDLDATLDPILGREIYKKGKNFFLNLGGKELEYDPKFKLYLVTKLSNPHYIPEIAAKTTLINFIATEEGLEDQLLGHIVGKEAPDKEAEKKALTEQFTKYKIQLMELENNLLHKLANAPEDILSDVPLIESLEATKATSTEINEAVAKGKETEIGLNKAREVYRPVAAEGAMLYFMLTNLSTISAMYYYSLDAFLFFFFKGLAMAPAADTIGKRVEALCNTLRLTIYTWLSRGLFEAHKLIFLTQLTINLIKRKKLPGIEVEDRHIQFLLRGPKKLGEENTIEWLPESQWAACCALGELEEFQKFPADLVEASPRFKEWFNHVSPETEKLPLDWASLDRSPFLKMLVVRSLRPDRMTTMLSQYVGSTLPNGPAYIECDATLNFLEVMDDCIADSNPVTPLYFILSPGADVVSNLDKLAEKYGFNKGAEYHNVSMGQGQDVIAMEALELAHRNGHWVILNNVHLMPRWLIDLEKKLDSFAADGSHEKFRLFLTSDPSKSIPIGLLNRCIKLTNEPPSGLKANLKRAVSFFSKDYIEELDSKTKSILFGLCYFHAVLIERKLYGPLGFNMMYPFAIGDLRDSAVCLTNYMENATGGKIPWEDLKYLFGEIMYGGHIVNDFDRTLANSYLDAIMKEELLDESEMYPFAGDEKESFKAPPPSSSEKQIEHIDSEMKSDTPIAFGLHPNAEIDFRTKQSNTMFETIMEMMPRDGGSGGEGLSPQHIAENTLNDILERFGEKKFDTEEISRSLDEVGPFQNVFIQECSAMNVLLTEIKRSLAELNLGFAGELTMSDSMEGLMDSLFMDKVPEKWKKLSWPSLRTLPAWLSDLNQRFQQLEEWTANPSEVPKVTWLSGLINPQSFLTAIAQVAAQRNKWELDKLVVNTEVTKRQLDEVDAPSRDGALIHGLYLQGGRWDMQNGMIDKSKPKEMFSPMPVMNCKAVSADKAEAAGIYQCPCYKTVQRGPTYIFQAQLKTKSPAQRWVLAGVALIADVL